MQLVLVPGEPGPPPGEEVLPQPVRARPGGRINGNPWGGGGG